MRRLALAVLSPVFLDFAAVALEGTLAHHFQIDTAIVVDEGDRIRTGVIVGRPVNP